MRKWLIIGMVLLIPVGFILYNNGWFSPLPVSSVSKSEVINKLEESHNNTVKITEENGYEWYITQMDKGKGYDDLKKMFEEKGWKFSKQEGSGYFFEKENEEIIVTTEMWTQNYIIFKAKKGWSKSE